MPTRDGNIEILKEVMKKFGLTVEESDDLLLTKISEKALDDNIDLEALTLKQLKGVMNDIKENYFIKPEPIQVENLANDIYKAHIHSNPQAKPVKSEFPQVNPLESKFNRLRRKNIEILKDAMETFNLPKTEFKDTEELLLKEISDKASQDNVDLEALTLKQLTGFTEAINWNRLFYGQSIRIEDVAKFIYDTHIKPQPEPTDSNTAAFKGQFHGVLSKAES